MRTPAEITLSEDIIDSRDLIARIEFLEYILEDNDAFEVETEEEREELKKLKEFAAGFEGYGDFEHGESIISGEYFVEYTKQLITDCGYISKDMPSFISDNIDWEGVAEDIKVDYMEHNGYYMRA